MSHPLKKKELKIQKRKKNSKPKYSSRSSLENAVLSHAVKWIKWMESQR